MLAYIIHPVIQPMRSANTGNDNYQNKFIGRIEAPCPTAHTEKKKEKKRDKKQKTKKDMILRLSAPVTSDSLTTGTTQSNFVMLTCSVLQKTTIF